MFNFFAASWGRPSLANSVFFLLHWVYVFVGNVIVVLAIPPFTHFLQIIANFGILRETNSGLASTSNGPYGATRRTWRHNDLKR